MSSVGRKLGAQGMIVLAVCVGGWHMVNQPMARELAQLEADIEVSRQSENPEFQPVATQVAQEAAKLRAWIANVENLNAAAGDSAELYRAFSALAKEQGVTLQSLLPGELGRNAKDAPVQAIRVTLVFEGRYERIVSFLQAMNGIEGFVRPVSLTIAPLIDSEQELVVAKLECDWLRFMLPETLHPFKGEAHAES